MFVKALNLAVGIGLVVCCLQADEKEASPVQPILASHVRQILDSEYLLKDLVRAADIERGSAFEKRPHFEKEE